jgi:hypothetical protein
MYTENSPLAGRASSDRQYRPVPRSSYRPSAFGNGPRKRPSTIGRTSRALARFSVVALVSVCATVAWQSYGAGMVKALAPSLGRLLPASAPSPSAISAEVRAQLKPVTLDLAVMKHSVEQLTSNQDQLVRREDQLAQAFATLQAAKQDIDQKILALTAPRAAHVLPPPKSPQPQAQ